MSNADVAEREKLEAHFADCKSCLATLSFLAQEFVPPESLPPQVLNRARSLTQLKQSFGWNWRWGLAAASACVLVIAAFLVWQIRSDRTSVPPADLVAQQNEPSVTPKELPTNETPSKPAEDSPKEKPRTSGARETAVRGSGQATNPTLISPRENSVVHLPLTLRWLPVPDATVYEAKIVTPDGTPVITQQTNGTELRLSTNSLQSDSKYFVSIVAHVDGGRTVKSGIVGFRVASQ